jgi:hypothetical protein
VEEAQEDLARIDRYRPPESGSTFGGRGLVRHRASREGPGKGLRFFLRSGAGVEPTEPWAARPHWF